MAAMNVMLLNWNVRGLNSPIRRDAVRDMVTSTHATLIRLQETKLHHIDDAIVATTLGQHFTQNYSYLPANGVRGGILIAASDRYFRLISTATTSNTITVTVQMLNEGQEWKLTSVYGPQGNQQKREFIEELKSLKQVAPEKWLILGDFNLIYKAEDKSNSRINRRMMGKFRDAIEHLELKELNLHGRKFTWSNGQENPTMTRIDMAFCSVEWEEEFPTSHLQALASTLSDHCPLLLQRQTQTTKFRGFRFEKYWIHMPRFQDTVKQAWSKQLHETDALRKIHIKLSRTTKALKLWQKTHIGNIKQQIAVAKQILWGLDVAEEARNLTVDERDFRARIKLKYQGLIAIEKIKAKQRARMTNVRTTDTNSKLFYIRANGRKRKNHIQVLQTKDGFAVAHKDKERVIEQHFQARLGTRDRRQISLNWEELGMQSFDLQELDSDITEEEVARVVMEMPPDKAPGPDGFIGIFFKTCWPVIKQDMLHVFHQISQLRGSMFNLVNSANMVLLPKKDRSIRVGDYRPISLIHSIAKIFSKILANRLAPKLNHIVSTSQSAFVKGRCIHDNFVFVQGMIKELSRKKRPTLFMKLDIAKAFDSVDWSYLLELLQQLGFGPRWREWITISLANASSRVLLNGQPGKPIKHCRGLRQGTPCPPCYSYWPLIRCRGFYRGLHNQESCSP